MLLRFERVRWGSPVELDRRVGGQQLGEEHAAFEAGEVHAEAVVLGDPERQVRVGAAVDVEALGVVEDVLVAVGRRVVHRDLVAGLDLDASHFGVGGGGSPEVVQRVGPPQDLLDRALDQGGVGSQLGQLVRVLEERQQPRRQHRLGGVEAGGDELDEERPEVDLAHHLPTELGAEDQRREVFAGRLLAPSGGELDGVHRHLEDGVGRVGGVVAARVDVAVLAGGVRLGPVVDLRPILLRDADELADDLRREARRDVVDELHVAVADRVEDLPADHADAISRGRR